MRTYRVNEVYRSYQGEGIRTGTENVFLRFAGCNMRCQKDPGLLSPGGFDCDTEFESGRTLGTASIVDWIKQEAGECRWIIATGGEPGLQLDETLIADLHAAGFKIAIETNGSIALPAGIDWITVSPKVAEHCIRQKKANEVKYVRGYGQGIPKTVVEAEHYLLSPVFAGDQPDPRAIEWCRKLCRENPPWQMTMQRHKLTGIR